MFGKKVSRDYLSALSEVDSENRARAIRKPLKDRDGREIKPLRGQIAGKDYDRHYN